MIGRWTGAVEAFTDKMDLQKILRFIAPYLAFGVFFLYKFALQSIFQPMNPIITQFTGINENTKGGCIGQAQARLSQAVISKDIIIDTGISKFSFKLSDSLGNPNPQVCSVTPKEADINVYKDDNLIGNGRYALFPLNYNFKDPPFEIKVNLWSLDDTYTHTIGIGIKLKEKTPLTIGQALMEQS